MIFKIPTTLLAIFSLIFFGPLYASGFSEIKITDNGNFLFYSNPVALKVSDGALAISYLTSDGRIICDVFKNGQKLKTYFVHDYINQINRKIGNADDHAAPAIFFDPGSKKLYLATSYHGTDMYIYTISLEDSVAELLSVWRGGYTYPRFVQGDGNFYLIARRKSDGYRDGDLIGRDFKSNFQAEFLILGSGMDKVIYAGTPYVFNNQLHFVYSIHSHVEGRLQGLTYASFNLDSKLMHQSCNLQFFLDKNYFSSRPTGLSVVNGKVTFGVSSFSLPVTYSSAQKNNYKEKQTVQIIQGIVDDCQSFSSIFRRDDISMPYYDSDVAIGAARKFLFFDNDRFYTNNEALQKSGCMKHSKMLYPNFVQDNSVVYAVMNTDYSIRDFNNSLFLCLEK